jgi:hypothetical protein
VGSIPAGDNKEFLSESAKQQRKTRSKEKGLGIQAHLQDFIQLEKISKGGNSPCSMERDRVTLKKSLQKSKSML